MVLGNNCALWHFETEYKWEEERIATYSVKEEISKLTICVNNLKIFCKNISYQDLPLSIFDLTELRPHLQ